MSQATLLEQVSRWSEETCGQELRSVLPNTDSWDEHIRILKVITEMFLPHLSVSELEEECFSKVLPKVVKMFSSLVDEIAKQIGGLSSQNSELRLFLRNILQVMISILEALSGVVRHLCTYEEAPALDAIRSLPSCILTLLKDTFQHCKESESVYSGRLSLVADLLQALFKEAYSLQKGLMELLEKIDFESNISEEEVFDIVTVIHSLLEICTLISNLDVALHANTWKFIIKQSMKYQALLEGQLRHSDIVSLLCNDLLMSFRNCCELAEQMQHTGLQDMAQNSEYKLFQKTAKMCRFFANTLVHYIKVNQANLPDTSPRFPPSLWSSLVSTTHCNEMRSMVLVAMDPLITQLLPCRDFAEALTPDVLLPHCLLLTNIMGKLRSQPEEVLLLWCEGSQFPEEIPRLSIFQALLQSFRGCTVERAVPVLLPGLMMNGQAQSQVTLHHHVCVQLSACLATLPAPIFPQLERALLEAVLQPDTQTAVLAVDVWCFLARYGTAELCLHHVTLTAHLLCPLESYHLSHLGMLLRRMMFFMTPHHQVEFVETFSPQEAENLLVWSNVLRRALSEDVRKRVEQDIVNLASSMITNWLEKGCRLGELEKVVRIHEGSYNGRTGESALYVRKQLCCGTCFQVQAYPTVRCTLQLLLSISAVLVRNIDFKDICQALACLSNLLSSKCPDVIMLSGLDFLASLGHLSIPPEMQSEVLPRLCSLFSAFLSEKTWILHQHALETFSLFAEVTSHEAVISQSLTSDEVKNEVVSFLSKTLNVQETDDVCIERLKLERSIYETHRERLETYKTFPLQPCSKRARQQTNEEQEFEKYLQAAESNLKALQTLSEQKPIPDWVTARLRELHPLITKINTALPPQT
uniref:Fignl1 interacting regulator of recombination and mitosis n=1 Tax=Scleropages formosus TaxID=113540 RepID=A0A8C9W3G0_SCLFO